MYFSKQFLNPVAYATLSSHTPFLGFGRFSKITIHFKEWYKPRKVIKFDWVSPDGEYWSEPKICVQTYVALMEALEENDKKSS